MSAFRVLAPILRRAVAPTGQERYASIYVASRLSSATAGAGLGIAAFAVAGASQVGSFAVVAAVCIFGGGMAGGWMSQGLLRYHQQCGLSFLRLLRWSSWRGGAFTMSVVAIASTVAASLPSSVDSGWVGSFVLAALFTVVLAMRMVQVARAMAQYEGPKVMVLEIAQAVSIASPPLLVSNLAGPLPFLWRCLIVATVINLSAMAVARLMSARSDRSDSSERVRSVSGRQFFQYGAPLGVWIGLSSIYQNADRVMLAWLVSDKVAGEYSLLYDIATRGLLLPITAISGAASSAVLRLFNTGDGHNATTANRSLMTVQAVALGGMLLPVCAAAVLATTYVAWFDFRHALASVLVYLAAAVWACGDTLQRERMGSGDTAPLVRWLAFSAGVAVVLNFIAIPTLGVIGAAAVTLISSVIYVSLVMHDAGFFPTRTSADQVLSTTDS